jgi:hypothetical protein
MKSSRSSLLTLAAFASLASGLSLHPGSVFKPGNRNATEGTSTRTVDNSVDRQLRSATQRQVEQAMDRGFLIRSSAFRRPGPGWTQAQVQRMARKRRNVARNRRAHR